MPHVVLSHQRIVFLFIVRVQLINEALHASGTLFFNKLAGVHFQCALTMATNHEQVSSDAYVLYTKLYAQRENLAISVDQTNLTKLATVTSQSSIKMYLLAGFSIQATINLSYSVLNMSST